MYLVNRFYCLVVPWVKTAEFMNSFTHVFIFFIIHVWSTYQDITLGSGDTAVRKQTISCSHESGLALREDLKLVTE